MDAPNHVAAFFFCLFGHFPCALSTDVVTTARADQDVIVVDQTDWAAISVEFCWVEILLTHHHLFFDLGLDTHSIPTFRLLVAIDRCYLLPGPLLGGFRRLLTLRAGTRSSEPRANLWYAKNAT